jgi:tetratricopeptide (TPR) repeat protein
MPKSTDEPSEIISQPSLQNKKNFAVAFFLLIATLIAYAPAIRGGFIWDDDAHVTRPELGSLAGLQAIWLNVGATQQYYPLLHSFFWLQYQFWGDDPQPYHVVNVILHSAAAFLVYLILKKLPVPGAVFAAAVFALHPIEVESVAWISEQKNTLSAVFYLSSMLMYIEFDQTRERSTYLYAIALFILGVLTKTVTATLPAALLVILWWKRGKISWRRDVLPLVWWFIVGIVAGLFTAWLERKQIGAEGQEFAMSFSQRIVLCGRVIWFYFGKLLWPANLIFVYPRWTIDSSDLRQWLFPITAFLAAIGLWMMRHRSRAPLAAALLFVGTLFPVLGFFNVYPFIFSFVADHFQYLAGLAIIVPLCAIATVAFKRQLLIGRGVAVALLITLACLTWRQSSIYADQVTLYQTTIQRNPQCWLAYDNLGVLFTKTPSTRREGIELIKQSLEIYPTNPTALNNLGYEMGRDGKYSEAINYVQQSVDRDPKVFLSQTNLGTLLAQSGRMAEAVPHFEQAARLRPQLPVAHTNLANALAASGQTPQAIIEFQRALELDPNNQYAQGKLTLLRNSRP